MNRLIYISGILLVYIVILLGQFTPNPNSPVGKNEHPRLFLTGSNVNDIRTNIQNNLQTEWQEFINECDSRYNDPNEWTHVLNYAFIHQMGLISGFTYGHTLSEYETKAINAITTLSADGNYDSNEWRFFVESSVICLPLGYDWMFDLLDTSQKQSLTSKIKNTLLAEDLSENPLRHDAIGNALVFLGALSMYGDGYEDNTAQQYCNYFESKEIGADGSMYLKNMVGSEGGTNSGFGYIQYHYPIFFTMLETWRSATLEDYFQSSGYFRYFPLYLLYHIQPIYFSTTNWAAPHGRDYFLIKDAHDGSADKPYDVGILLNESTRMLNRYDSDMAGLAKWLIESRTGEKIRKSKIDIWKYYVLQKLMTYNPAIPLKSPVELNLPLTRYFKGMGTVIMRSGFDSVDDVLIAFKAMPWAFVGGYWSNRNQGHFSIYKYGPLAFQGGGGGHHKYLASGQGSNIVLFEVPGQNYTVEYSDKGGQRAKINELPGANSLQIGSEWDLGGIKRLKIEANKYDYIYADITRAYAGPTTPNNPVEEPQKVSLFTREFVYIRPDNISDSDYIFVYDRIHSVDAQIKKRWMLHMAYEPQINGTPNTISAWETEYANADMVTVTNTYGYAHGRLFMKTLLPQNVNIHKIGGYGYEFMDITGTNDDSHFSGYSTSSSPLDSATAYFAGSYKIEIRPQAQQKEDFFFNVFQTADANSTTSMESVQLIDNNVNYYGATIDNNTVFFSKTTSPQSMIDFTVNATGLNKYLITNLMQGLYFVHVNGNLISIQDNLVDDSGILYFEYNGGGTFTISRSNDFTPPGTPSGIRIKN